MATKCHDCGSRDFVSSGTRVDVCNDCMDLRLRLIRGVETGTVTVGDFKAVQKAMNGDLFRQGRGARKMRKVLASNSERSSPISGRP